MIINNHLTLQSPPFTVDMCRDLELVSSLARAHNSESLFESNVCNIFCRGFSRCLNFWGVCYSRVSARQELTVPANGTPALITVPSPPYTVSRSASWSVTQSVSLFLICCTSYELIDGGDSSFWGKLPINVSKKTGPYICRDIGLLWELLVPDYGLLAGNS